MERLALLVSLLAVNQYHHRGEHLTCWQTGRMESVRDKPTCQPLGKSLMRRLNEKMVD